MGYKDFTDIAVDSKGSNSQTKRYISVEQDALSTNLAGKKVLFNPAYELCNEYLLHIEDAKERDASTEAMGVIPEWQHRVWFKEMTKRNRWRIVWRFPRGTKLFSRPDPE